MCDMDDQNTKYVIASKGRKVVYLSLNLQQHQGMQPIWKVHLKDKLIYVLEANWASPCIEMYSEGTYVQF